MVVGGKCKIAMKVSNLDYSESTSGSTSESLSKMLDNTSCLLCAFIATICACSATTCACSATACACGDWGGSVLVLFVPLLRLRFGGMLLAYNSLFRFVGLYGVQPVMLRFIENGDNCLFVYLFIFRLFDWDRVRGPAPVVGAASIGGPFLLFFSPRLPEIQLLRDTFAGKNLTEIRRR